MPDTDLCGKRLVFWGQYRKPTCWFNVLLISLLYSQRNRDLFLRASKKWDTNIELFKLFKHVLKHKYVKSKISDKDYDFFEKYSPIHILHLLNEYDNTKFMFTDFTRGYYPMFYITNIYNTFGISSLMISEFKDGKVGYDLFNDLEKAEYNSNRNNKIDFTLYDNEYITSRLNSTPDILIVRIANYNLTQNRGEYRYFLSLPYYYLSNQSNYLNITSHNDNIIFNNQQYILDAVIVKNWNEADVDHVIAGITCKNERYVYNGWNLNTVNNKRLPCDLFKHRWDVKNTGSFCINNRTCQLTNSNETTKCYSFSKGERLLIYVKNNSNRSPLTPEQYTLTPEYISYNSIKKTRKRKQPSKRSPISPSHKRKKTENITDLLSGLLSLSISN